MSATPFFSFSQITRPFHHLPFFDLSTERYDWASDLPSLNFNARALHPRQLVEVPQHRSKQLTLQTVSFSIFLIFPTFICLLSRHTCGCSSSIVILHNTDWTPKTQTVFTWSSEAIAAHHLFPLGFSHAPRRGARSFRSDRSRPPCTRRVSTFRGTKAVLRAAKGPARHWRPGPACSEVCQPKVATWGTLRREKKSESKKSLSLLSPSHDFWSRTI